jgi:lysozyme family protein
MANEGGFTDNPNDHGGPTNYGITQADLARWRGTSISAADVKNLTVSEAEEIYEAFYWDPLECDQIQDQGIATAILDCGILNGIGTCARMAQQVVGVAVDGHIGPETIDAINAFSRAQFINKLIAELLSRYKAIVDSNPSQEVFLKGWAARAERLQTLVN